MKKKAMYMQPALEVITLHTEGQLMGASNPIQVKDSTDSGKTVTDRTQVLSNDMQWDGPDWTSGDDYE